MSKRLRHSRWRRLPGLYRVGERPAPDPNQELERLTVYLPRGLIDRAEAMARSEGAESLQAYCEELLRRSIEGEAAREKVEEVEARIGPLEGFDAVANDPEYLAEWSSIVPRLRDEPARVIRVVAPVPLPPPREDVMASGGWSDAARVVLRHTLLSGDDPTALLASLRRGESVSPDSARELLQALVDLEAEHRESTQLDRRLAFALHRLAFEGQVLLTDAWPTASADAAAVDLLRLVQEGVDRVLSGEDIRYYQ